MKFKQVYDVVKKTEQALIDMNIDVDNVGGNTPKCLVTVAQANLLDSYAELLNMNITLKNTNLATISDKLSECMDCLNSD